MAISPLRCRGCGRAFGLCTGAPMVSVYCSTLCADDGPLFQNEERDDLIRAAVAHGAGYEALAKCFGLSTRRIFQVLRQE